MTLNRAYVELQARIERSRAWFAIRAGETWFRTAFQDYEVLGELRAVFGRRVETCVAYPSLRRVPRTPAERIELLTNALVEDAAALGAEFLVLEDNTSLDVGRSCSTVRGWAVRRR